MQCLRALTAAFSVAACLASYSASGLAASAKQGMSDYPDEPMPPGFQVIMTELEGPVFADATGHTFYKWPKHYMRQTYGGEDVKQTACTDVPNKVSAGLNGPYPAGLVLPGQDHRPACTDYWPPVYAAADAKPVGNWTILERNDGKKQWAYKGRALYTSFLDRGPGDTWGATKHTGETDGHFSFRKPVGPEPLLPAQFSVGEMWTGVMLTTAKGWSVYTYDKDTSTKSNCNETCLKTWSPVLAPQSAVIRGDWSVIDRGGAKQWTYRGKPLYRRLTDSKERSFEGGDEPGWHNVFLHRVPGPPKGFQITDNAAGQLITSPNGKAVYFYLCSEDAADFLECDFPSAPQEYRLAICGNGDVDRCNKTFPYVIADKSAKSDTRAWSTMDIDPKTGHEVAAGSPGALHVWAFRRRPIYNFVGDKTPTDFEGNGWGSDHGESNGFLALWMRDDYLSNDGVYVR